MLKSHSAHGAFQWHDDDVLFMWPAHLTIFSLAFLPVIKSCELSVKCNFLSKLSHFPIYFFIQILIITTALNTQWHVYFWDRSFSYHRQFSSQFFVYFLSKKTFLRASINKSTCDSSQSVLSKFMFERARKMWEYFRVHVRANENLKWDWEKMYKMKLIRFEKKYIYSWEIAWWVCIGFLSSSSLTYVFVYH